MAQTAAKRIQSSGASIDYTPVSAVTAGDVVEIGSIPMVADRDIAADVLGAVSCEGVFDLPKTSDEFSLGDAVYWNSTGNPVTGAAGSGAADSATGNLAGVCVKAAAAGDSYVRTKLTAAKRTTTLGGSVVADDVTGNDAALNVTGKSGAGGGAGGTVPIAGGVGHTNGAGGAAGITGGAGAGTGAGGAVNLTGGASGNGATGNGGAATHTGGAALSTNGTGGAASVVGGVATGTGTGGAVTITGGASAGAGGTAGAVTIDAGAKAGGTGAAVTLGGTNATQVNIGATSIPTVSVGPQTRGIGASTAAAGADETDAAALPAGTAGVYPTTAADDSKGVIIDVADKVTGRMLMIGNGVSNKILKVYPPAGGTINGAAANAAFSSVSGKGVIVVCLNSGANTWLAW